VVHRDIKPENILLTGDQAIVADFGIARAVEAAGGERLTGTGLAIGTPAYMSPEQALGQKDVDARSDVYALGCVVYEVVAGQPPFEGATAQALLAKHAADTVPGLRTSDPAIPPYVERAVEKALAKDPAERFQTPSAFAEALTTGTVVARVRRRRRWLRGLLAGSAVGAALVAAAGWWLATMARGPEIERLAVLPFTNLMNDPEQQYMVQGVHDALISELQQVGVTVIARTSVMRYQDTEKPVRDIARELDVDAVIEGSAFRAGDSVGIRARLVDGATEAQLWSQSYDGDLRDVLALYRDLTGAIAREIQLVLTPQAEARLASARQVNPETYEAYVKGMYHVSRGTPEEFELGLAHLNQAIERDPEDPLAYAGLALGYINGAHDGVVPPQEAFPRAETAARQALKLDETLAEAQLGLALVELYYRWDKAGAKEGLERALELNPNLVQAHRHYGYSLLIFERADEAVAHVKRVTELDPLTPIYTAELGEIYVISARYEEARAQARKSLELDPDLPHGWYVLGVAFALQGMYEEAIAALQTLETLSPGYRLALAITYAMAERREEALQQLAEYRRAGTRLDPFSLARFHTALGQKDEAFRWLEVAYEHRHPFMPWLEFGFLFEPLRDDPRFEDLLRRMNLPQ
jgi:serine/threonine-protein kinase